jgi:hypothetical protein
MLEERLLIAERAVVALGTDWHYLNKEAHKKRERHEKNERGESSGSSEKDSEGREKWWGDVKRTAPQPHGFVVFHNTHVFPPLLSSGRSCITISVN